MRQTILTGVLCGLILGNTAQEAVRYAAPHTHVVVVAEIVDWWEWIWHRPILRKGRIDASTKGDM